MDDATFLRHVKDFHEKKELKEVVDLVTLERGARLAMSLRALQKYYPHTTTERESEELQWEDDGNLKSLTKSLKVLLITCAIGAIVQ